MEIGSISHVLNFAWLNIILESAEVVFAELLLGVTGETLVQRWNLSFVILSVNSGASSFSE